MTVISIDSILCYSATVTLCAGHEQSFLGLSELGEKRYTQLPCWLRSSLRTQTHIGFVNRVLI